MNLTATEVLLYRIAKLFYIFYIPSTSSGPETCRRAHVVPPVEGLNILPARLALRARMAGRSIPGPDLGKGVR